MPDVKKGGNFYVILSLVLGISGALFALARGHRLLGFAISWGMLAASLGYLALNLLPRHPNARRRKALAFTGIFLGIASMVVSYSALFINPARPRAKLKPQPVQHFPNRLAPPQPISPPLPQPRPPLVSPTLPASIALDDSLTNFNSNLPIIIIDTGRQYIHRYGDTLATARLIPIQATGAERGPASVASSGRASITGPADYQGRALLKLHGNTTLRLPKRSYSFHPVDDQTNQVKIPIFGLPKEEDWILLAPYEDKTMMRDVLAYELCNRMGRYAPRTRYFELFVNTSGQPLSRRDYMGVFVLVEKIKRGKNRVDIEKLAPTAITEPDITGGYIFKRDHAEDPGGFYTHNGGPYFPVYPKPRDITPAQRSWLIRYLNNFETALEASWFADPRKGYPAYLDVDSFIDAHWLIELSKNIDGFRYSAYLTKDRNGKLKLEPPWDWNRSFGNADYHGGWEVESWYWPYLRPNEISWYGRLQQDPKFLQRCTERWFELRRTVFDPDQITRRIDQLAAELAEAQPRNFQRWPILGRQVTCNYYVGNSYHDEVRWLKNWIRLRILWIDQQFSPPSKPKPQPPVSASRI